MRHHSIKRRKASDIQKLKATTAVVDHTRLVLELQQNQISTRIWKMLLTHPAYDNQGSVTWISKSMEIGKWKNDTAKVLMIVNAYH